MTIRFEPKDSDVLGKYHGEPLTPQQRANALLTEHQVMRIDPMETVEVAVEQRLVGLYSAAKTLRELSMKPAGREVIARPSCIEDIELVRDTLSRILERVGQ